MINIIAHLADIHVRNSTLRLEEYREVLNKTVESLKNQKPDRIVIVGDLVNDYLDLKSEQIALVSDFLHDLSNICKVIITRGNHDFRRKNKKRKDSIYGIIHTMRNENVVYLNKTGFYEDENVVWTVWHHGEKSNNPWKTIEGKKHLKSDNYNTKTYIDLFHDPVNNSVSATGFELKSKRYYSINDFKGHYSFFGDIHKLQYFKDNTKAYPSSLLAQDYSEGDDSFHGYLVWDINTKSVGEIEVENNYSYKNILITNFTDFDDLDIEIDNPTKYMRVRLVWQTLPSVKNNENQRKIEQYLNNLYDNIIEIKNKSDFIVEDEINIDNSVNVENILEPSKQQEIFKDYLDEIGVDDDKIDDIIDLDNEITSRIQVDPITNIEWSIVKFGGRNFMSYENINIDWDDKDGLYQISGENTAGKTTILKLLSYVLFSKTLETETKMKFGDIRYINNKLDVDWCDGYVVLDVNNQYYGIKRKTVVDRKRNGEVKGVSTTVEYHILSSKDDEMTDETSIELLTSDNKIKTQKEIDSIIGTYNNYMRIVMTTSDTLNGILSSNMSEFIDNILKDGGLSIFDDKLNAVKEYQKEVNLKSRISCDIEGSNKRIDEYNIKIKSINDEIDVINKKDIPELNDRISVGEKYIEDMRSHLFKIDDEISKFNVPNAESEINKYEGEINVLENRKGKLNNLISELPEKYDEIELNKLIERKDEAKKLEYEDKLSKSKIDREIQDENHKIEIINGEIFTLNREINTINGDIEKLKNSKVCPTCNQEIKDPKHVKSITDNITLKNDRLKEIDEIIIQKRESIKVINESTIPSLSQKIIELDNKIKNRNDQLDNVLKRIGEINNDKDSVLKRMEYQNELNNIPLKIENKTLHIQSLKNKILEFEKNKDQIKKNEITNIKLDKAKKRYNELIENLNDLNESVIFKKTEISQLNEKISEIKKNIKEFKDQEYRDEIINTYKKCVHRDGIPKQLLVKYLIPNINKELSDILDVVNFDVWLDDSDLKPKLAYNETPHAVIDAISSSGKERTFSSIVLKVALNSINKKSKPTLFLLDEVMGKLDENSVNEFIILLDKIKKVCRKFIIIEHNHEVNPDYVIDVSRTKQGISSAEIY